MSASDALQKARERAKEMGLPYEGALKPQEAHEVLQTIENAKLVDVRTRAEWDWVGRIPGAVQIEFLTYPGNRQNPDFLKQLEQQVDKDARVMFICRSGGRSHTAASIATQAGFMNCYNVLEGFEGDRDEHGHRSTRGGWRAAGLPWVQG